MGSDNVSERGCLRSGSFRAGTGDAITEIPRPSHGRAREPDAKPVVAHPSIGTRRPAPPAPAYSAPPTSETGPAAGSGAKEDTTETGPQCQLAACHAS